MTYTMNAVLIRRNGTPITIPYFSGRFRDAAERIVHQYDLSVEDSQRSPALKVEVIYLAVDGCLNRYRIEDLRAELAWPTVGA